MFEHLAWLKPNDNDEGKDWRRSFDQTEIFRLLKCFRIDPNYDLRLLLH